MTRSVLAIAIAVLLISSTVLAQHPSTQATMQQVSHEERVTATSGDSQTDNPSQADKHATTNRSDEQFLKDFSQVTAAEVNKSDLAVWKAEYVDVKAFAARMVDVHAQTIGSVKMIAAQTNVGVKAKPDFMQRVQVALLDVSVGAAFDRAYMKAMVNDHEKVIEMLGRELIDGQDANVMEFAAEALSDAQQRLKMAQDLRAKVVADQNPSRSLARKDSSSPEKLATTR
jgi:putative membrane protein